MAEQYDIESAFLTRFATLGYTYVSQPNGPVVEPDATSINYTLDFIYADGYASAIGDAAANRFTGIFQVTIRVPVTTSTGDAPGLYTAFASAKQITDLFPRGISFGYPSITPTMYVHCKTPTLKHLGKITNEWYSLIIRVPFWTDI